MFSRKRLRLLRGTGRRREKHKADESDENELSLSLSSLLSKCLGARRTRVQGSQGRRGARRGNTYAKRVHARGALVRAAMKFSTPLLSLQRELHAIPAALFSVRAIRRLDRVDFSAPPDSPFPIRSISLAPRSTFVRIYN